jgi:D-alanyl-lipoteichoic acid acyltransferase DltB (MBOAT superfamily)
MPALPNPVCWLLTFTLVDIAFVFFRSPNLATAGLLLSKLFTWHHAFSTANLQQVDGEGLMMDIFVLAQVCGIIAAFFGKSSDQLAREFKPNYLNYAATAAFALIAFVYLNSNVEKPFVYFAF